MSRARCGALLMALVACAALSFVNAAHAASVNTSLTGDFSSSLTGTGTATLDSASGNFRQWLLFTHANIGVSASPQTVGLGVSPVNFSTNLASGDSNFDYDPATPGTPLQVNSLDTDFSGGATIPVSINVNPIQINTSLGNFQLQLTFSGQLSNLGFVSDGPSLTPGGAYEVPGNFVATIGGNVTGQLVNVPLINTVNLGTVFTLEPDVIEFPANLSGDLLLSDLTGGSGPFPADMLAQFFSGALGDIEVPLDLPIDVELNQSVPNGQSGFNQLNIQGSINANLTLGNPEYLLSNTVPQALVPEPSSFALAAMAGLALVGAGYRRRRSA